MKALTIREPWAWCIASGAKDVENRGRAVSYRGPLAVHAAASVSPTGCIDDRVIAQFDRWRSVPNQGDRVGEHIGDLSMLRQRHVIAVVDLVDCHEARGSGCCTPWGDAEYGLSGAFHLVLASPRRLVKPFAASGRLGLWDVDDDLIAAACPEPVGSSVSQQTGTTR